MSYTDWKHQACYNLVCEPLKNTVQLKTVWRFNRIIKKQAATYLISENTSQLNIVTKRNGKSYSTYYRQFAFGYSKNIWESRLLKKTGKNVSVWRKRDLLSLHILLHVYSPHVICMEQCVCEIFLQRIYNFNAQQRGYNREIAINKYRVCGSWNRCYVCSLRHSLQNIKTYFLIILMRWFSLNH